VGEASADRKKKRAGAKKKSIFLEATKRISTNQSTNIERMASSSRSAGASGRRCREGDETVLVVDAYAVPDADGRPAVRARIELPAAVDSTKILTVKNPHIGEKTDLAMIARFQQEEKSMARLRATTADVQEAMLGVVDELVGLYGLHNIQGFLGRNVGYVQLYEDKQAMGDAIKNIHIEQIPMREGEVIALHALVRTPDREALLRIIQVCDAMKQTANQVLEFQKTDKAELLRHQGYLQRYIAGERQGLRSLTRQPNAPISQPVPIDDDA
jgi:hypothetical protein